MTNSANERVVDASALIIALGDRTDHGALLRDKLRSSHQHAPHLIDAELGSALRRHVRTQELTPEDAHTALHTARPLITHRYPHAGPLTEIAWGLRDQLSFYDALYAALAARLRIPLLTADTRLANAHDLPCEIELT